jgi:hypothetical protein
MEAAWRQNGELKMKRTGKILAAAAIALLLFSGGAFLSAAPAYADPGGTLTIRVGYMGYAYVEKKTYTAADLRALGTEVQYYSYVDGLPAPVMMAAEGVSLRSIIVDAGIDPGSAQRYYFRASDGHEAYAEFTTQSLLDTTRYWFPKLSDTWDRTANGGRGGPGIGADEGMSPTDTMIALKEYHERFLSAPREDLMYDAYGFRLVYGAAYVGDPDASFHDSVHSVTHIDVQLVGSPPEERGENNQQGLIGADISNATTGSGNDGADGDGKGAGNGDGSGAGTGTGTNGGDGSGTGSGSGAGSGAGGGGTEVGGAGGVGAENIGGEISASQGGMVEITMGDGTVVRGREIDGGKVLMELAYTGGGGGGGGESDGDDPWNEYDVAEDATPLKLPYDSEAAGAVSGVMGLSFAFGAVVQGDLLPWKRKPRAAE